MRAGVGGALVEPHSSDDAIDVGGELEAQFEGLRLAQVDDGRRFGIGPQRIDSRVLRRINRDAWSRGFDVPAIVDCAADDGELAGSARREGVRPVLSARGAMPGQSAIDRDFDDRDHSAAKILGRARECGGDPRLQCGSRQRRSDGRHGRLEVVRRSGGRQSRHERPGLHSHIGKQVDRSLLQIAVGRRRAAVVPVVESPGVLNGPGAKHQRAAIGPIQRQAVRHGAGPERAAIIL